MSDAEIQKYGVNRQAQSGGEADLAQEEIAVLGFTVLRGAFSPAELGALKEALDAQSANGHDGMAEDRNVVRCPLAANDLFLSTATQPRLMALCERIFGPNFVLLQQNGVVNASNEPHYQSRWHRDLTYQHFTATEPIAINALACLDDFTAETGGTMVLPGTHKQAEFPSDAYVRKHETLAAAKAGDLIIMDSMLFHRAGRNVSGHLRRAVNHLIGKPFLAQQIDIPELLGGRHEKDPFLRQYLGYRWNPAKSVQAWRKARSGGG